MLTPEQRSFVEAGRVGRLATVDPRGAPHVVPVCYALDGASLFITIDEKPKRTDRPLQRLRNIAANPAAALVVDRYDEDWRRLGWVMLRGRAEILRGGAEHAAAQALLRTRYPQLRAMALDALPVIAIRIDRVTGWGDLSADGGTATRG